eukprot:15832476-Heterocapsa_arctica.AAC.1
MSEKKANTAFDPIGDPSVLPRAGGDDDAAMLEPPPLAPMGQEAAQQNSSKTMGIVFATAN